MELLFSKEKFSQEFKEQLGFIDADIRYERLKPSIEAATDEFIDIVGIPTYNTLVQGTADKALLAMAKYAIALKAYINYAPTADLSVTNNGRVIRRDEHLVSPYQWQIEANDEALEQLYYRALDRLLKFMVKNSIPINLQKYRHSDLKVPTLEDFENFFNINNSYLLYLKLIPAMREFERIELSPRLHSINIIDEQLKNLIQIAEVNYALAWGMRRLNIQLFPKGVLQEQKMTSAGKTQKQGQSIEYLQTAMLFEKDTANYLLKIEALIQKITVAAPSSTKIDLPELGFGSDDKFVDV